jgi:hypothetical protein
MDDPLLELESELKALRPRRPSADLLQRLAQDLDAEAPASAPAYAAATSFRSWKWLGWQWAAAAAALAMLAVAGWHHLAPAPATGVAPASSTSAVLASRDTYRPVGATNVLYDIQDEGPVSAADSSTARRVRARYVDTYTWRNPATNASLKWSVPREEIRVIPASFH